MPYSNEKEVFDSIDDLVKSDEVSMEVRADRAATAMAYYEGLHWRAQRGFRHGYGSNANIGLRSQWNPDRTDLRVTDNFITTLAIRLAAQTYPAHLDIDVMPGPADASADGRLRAQAAEEALLSFAESGGLLAARRSANHRRVIMGDYGVGLSLDRGVRDVEMRGNRVSMADGRLRFFAFDPTKLVVDPHQNSDNLRDHDRVLYCDVWTLQKARRVFGDLVKDLKEKDCQTVGDLSTFQQTVSAITDGRLFSSMRAYSTAPGVLVRQLHVKDETGRFAYMYVVVEGGRNDKQRFLINEDDLESPFGGDGLPFWLYHSNRREGSIWSISDIHLVIDDQNRTNVARTIQYRQVQQSAHFKWRIDERYFNNGSLENAKAQLNNRLGGVIHGRMGSKHDNIIPPEIIPMPRPDSVVAEMADRESRAAREKVSRPDVSLGATKSHVPDSSFQTALNQADQPGNVRVLEDLETDVWLLRTLLGTVVKLVNERSPTTLGTLRKAGLSGEELAVFSGIDANSPGLDIKVRQSSVRHRSHELKKADQTQALTAGAITPIQFRVSRAMDLDSPIMEDDKLLTREATRAAMAVARGEEWMPLPLGEGSDVFVGAFRRALWDRSVRDNPEARERLMRAIDLQEQQRMMEIQAMQPQQPGAAPAPEPAMNEPMQPQSARISDILSAVGAV